MRITLPVPTQVSGLIRRDNISHALEEDSPRGREPEMLLVSLTDGRRMSVRYWSGRGRPLVLLHGLFDSGFGWDALAHATHRPCYALDLPGFGDSDAPKRPRISSFAKDVVAVTQQLDLSDFTLVGHSLGGAVAVAVSERIPEQVVSLVLLAPAGFGRQPLAEASTIPGLRSAVRTGTPWALMNPLSAASIYAVLVANGGLPDTEMLSRWRRSAFRIAPGAVAAAEAVAIAGRSRRAYHRRAIAYDGPVRALWGANDRLVPRSHVRAVERALPQARASVWERMGHHPQRERPVELARYIESAAVGGRKPRRVRKRRRASSD